MFCRKCYANLRQTAELNRCDRCGLAFDPLDSRTYLARPFPPVWRIISLIVGTTVVGFLVAFVVAMFQMAGAGGH